jgi:hypothetical protein
MKVVTKEQLVSEVEDMLACIKSDDSYGGFMEYDTIGSEGMPELKQGEFLLRASYRIGNSYGQGGMRIVE